MIKEARILQALSFFVLVSACMTFRTLPIPLFIMIILCGQMVYNIMRKQKQCRFMKEAHQPMVFLSTRFRFSEGALIVTLLCLLALSYQANLVGYFGSMVFFLIYLIDICEFLILDEDTLCIQGQTLRYDDFDTALIQKFPLRTCLILTKGKKKYRFALRKQDLETMQAQLAKCLPISIQQA